MRVTGEKYMKIRRFAALAAGLKLRPEIPADLDRRLVVELSRDQNAPDPYLIG